MLTSAEIFEQVVDAAGRTRLDPTVYSEADGPYELAALRYLTRSIEEAKPSLLDVAVVAAVLAERVAR